MRLRLMFALLFAAAAIGPAAAQRSDNERGGIRTETQDRLAASMDSDSIWNWVGLIGLLGLLGLRREHADDSYHPASID